LLLFFTERTNQQSPSPYDSKIPRPLLAGRFASTPFVPTRSFDMLRRSFLVLAVAALCAPAYAAELEVGAHAPEFKGLPGVDGKEYSLGDMKDAKVAVVCFTC